MQIRDFEKVDTSEFFYLWIVGTSEASFASILDLQRTLFYDLKNFNFSEIDGLPLSELYFLTISGPHEKKDDSRKTSQSSIMKRNIETLDGFGAVKTPK